MGSPVSNKEEALVDVIIIIIIIETHLFKLR